jgi:hypothetical protein
MKIGNYILSFRRETSAWAGENKTHIWEYIFRIEWLSPYEKHHRRTWEEQHPGEKYSG